LKVLEREKTERISADRVSVKVDAAECVPHPRVFFCKSVDSYESKGVEILASAKKRKRVCKHMKVKGQRLMSCGKDKTRPPVSCKC
jgi:hypothetical protein